MKKVRFLSAAALLFTIGVSNAAFAQPGRYGNGRYPQPVPGYRQPPVANQPQVVAQGPVIIIDADGRRNDAREYSNRRCDAQAQFDGRQRQRLERRYGYAPPLVLFVPDRFANRYGDYVSPAGLVYRRSRDGYFHLDNRYYADRWDDYSYNDNRRRF